MYAYYVFMYVCMYENVNTCLYVLMYVLLRVCIVYACMLVYVCMYVRMYVCSSVASEKLRPTSVKIPPAIFSPFTFPQMSNSKFVTGVVVRDFVATQ
jgi:hypothetical protein